MDKRHPEEVALSLEPSKSKGILRGLFYCPKCKQLMNADVVGCLNTN